MDAQLEHLACPGVITTALPAPDKAHVVFVAAEDGTAGVWKHCSNASAEAFGLLLAPRLGVSAPCVRIVDSAVMERAPSLLMERVGGAVEMSSLASDISTALLSTASAEGRDRLQQLGAVLALDLVLDNHDRFVCDVWRGNGNARNVLFGTLSECAGEDTTLSSRTVRIVAIDQPVRRAAAARCSPLVARCSPLTARSRSRSLRYPQIRLVDPSQRLSRRLLNEKCAAIAAFCRAVRGVTAGEVLAARAEPLVPSEVASRMAREVRDAAAAEPAVVASGDGFDGAMARAAVVLGRMRFDKALAWARTPPRLAYLRARLAESSCGDVQAHASYGALVVPRHPLAALRDFVMLACGCDVGPAGCAEVGRGMLRACARACVVLAPGSDALAELEAELEHCTLSATRTALKLESMHMRVAAIAAGLCEEERRTVHAVAERTLDIDIKV